MRLIKLVLWPAGVLFSLPSSLLPAAQAGKSPDKLAYGKYLVEEVAKCQDCHTPRIEKGEFDRSKWMKGSTLDFQPIEPVKGWHKTAPDLTGEGRLFQRWKEAGLVKFLMTGLGPTGNKADPPMPEYKLKQADAEAMVEYLKSLK